MPIFDERRRRFGRQEVLHANRRHTNGTKLHVCTGYQVLCMSYNHTYSETRSHFAFVLIPCSARSLASQRDQIPSNITGLTHELKSLQHGGSFVGQ